MFIGCCVECGAEYEATTQARAVKNGRKCIECRREYMRQYCARRRSTLGDKWKERLADKARMARARLDQDGLLKAWARNQVVWALDKGILKRERCQGCGANRTHAHHADYFRPLNVEWLCAVCHTARHAKADLGEPRQQTKTA